MTKCDGDPVVPRAKLDADLFLFVEPRGGEEIAAFPEDQCVAQIQPFQYRPKLRDPRVIVKRILQSKSSRKMQPDGKFRLRPPVNFETVFSLLEGRQWPTISRPRIGTPKCTIPYGFFMAEVMTTGAHAPENRPVRSQPFVQLLDV